MAIQLANQVPGRGNQFQAGPIREVGSVDVVKAESYLPLEPASALQSDFLYLSTPVRNEMLKQGLTSIFFIVVIYWKCE